MKIPKRFLRVTDEPLGEYACAACRFLTLREPPPGTYETCDVCGWEDDYVQFNDPDYTGGANGPSLNEWKKQFEAEELPNLKGAGFKLPPRA